MPQIKLKYASFIENEINKCVYGIYLFFGGEEEIKFYHFLAILYVWNSFIFSTFLAILFLIISILSQTKVLKKC